MCGRYVSPDESAMERACNITRAQNPFRTVFNAAADHDPADSAGGVDGLELCAMQRDLIPIWWAKPQPPRITINARAEEAAIKSMSRTAARHTHCLVPSLG